MLTNHLNAITMKRLILPLALILALAACNVSNKVVETPAQPVAIEDFLHEPFGFSETVRNFHENFPGLKETRVLRKNAHNPEKSDTIYKLYSRKSSVMIYKTHFNREMLLGGVILDNRIKLRNGITVGASREQVQQAFSNLPTGSSSTDTLKISSEADLRTLKFVFDAKGKVKRISFSGYVD